MTSKEKERKEKGIDSVNYVERFWNVSWPYE